VIRLRKITFNSKRLAQIKQAHRNLLFFLGHVANEINCLTKLLLWSDMHLSQDDPRTKAAAAQATILVKLLLAKQLEANDVLAKSYYPHPMRSELARYMSADAKDAELKLEAYFSKRENTIHYWVRNKFASHYELKQVGAHIQTARAAETLVTFLGDNHANTLHEMSEVVMNRAMLAGIDSEPAKAIEKAVGAVTQVTGWFLTFVDGFMIAVVDKSWPDDAGWGDMVDIEAQAFDEIRVPWFADFSSTASI
jgi:hypothetical protein